MQPGEVTAIAISVISLVLAAVSIGWNIYRDVILKPRVQVEIAVVELFFELLPERPKFISISATNFGPGEIFLQMIHAKSDSLWKRITNKRIFAVVGSDNKNPYCNQLPTKISEGEPFRHYLPYDGNSLFSDPELNLIGIKDSYGRIHWASKKQYKIAKKTWERDFLKV